MKFLTHYYEFFLLMDFFGYYYKTKVVTTVKIQSSF